MPNNREHSKTIGGDDVPDGGFWSSFKNKPRLSGVCCCSCHLTVLLQSQKSTAVDRWRQHGNRVSLAASAAQEGLGAVS